MAIALITVLVGCHLKIFEECKGLAPIMADEALLAFDLERYNKVVEELGFVLRNWLEKSLKWKRL